MFCHKCGNKLVKDATFCSYCGTKVEFAFTDADNNTNTKQPTMETTSNDGETTSKQVIEQNNESVWSNNKKRAIWENIKSKAKTFGWFIMILLAASLAKMIGRGYAKNLLSSLHLSNYDPMVIISYAVSGFVCGLIFGLIPYIIYKKRSNVEVKDCLLIFLVNGVLGLYGGIPYSFGGAILLSLIVLLISKNK